MKQIIRGFFLAGVGLCILGFSPKISQASEMNFSVKAILPENQRDTNQSYFDLRVTPGQEQVLQVELQNETDKDVTVETTANTATTNDNGLADYTNSSNKKDSSLAFSFADIAEAPKETLVPKNGKKILEVTLKMPEKEFDGFLLGGLYFKEKEAKDSAEKSKESVMIENKFAYTVGVLLSETDADVKPKLALNDAKASQKVGRNVVLLTMQNQHAALIQKMNVEAKIYDKNRKNLLYTKQQSDLKMAPNSHFNYSVPLDDQAFEPGTYEAEVVANDGYRDWKMTRTFEIKPDVAKEYNKTSLDVADKPREDNRLLVAGGVSLVIAVGGLAYWFGRRGHKTSR